MQVAKKRAMATTARRGATALLAAWIGIAVANPALAARPTPLPKGPGSLAGFWFNATFKPAAHFPPPDQVIKTADGALPPLQPWAAALQRKRLDDAVNGKPYASTKSRCLPAGLPQAMMSPKVEGIKIVEQPGEVIILFEEMNNFRVIRLNGKHPDDVEPNYWGDSIGHWEGDTLVVDTVGLSDETTLDMVGMPHSDALKITERFHRTSATRLDLQITLDDPKAFTHTWTTKTWFNLAPQDQTIREFICQNNRNKADNGVTSIQLPGAKP